MLVVNNVAVSMRLLIVFVQFSKGVTFFVNKMLIRSCIKDFDTYF